MKAAKVFLYLLIVVSGAAICHAEDFPQLTDGDWGVLTGGGTNPSKAVRDSVLLIGPWGSGAQANGQFEAPGGGRNWNGWTHYDITQPDLSHWQISDYQAANLGQTPEPGNLAAWCGELYYEACSETDVAGGYGNNWNEILQWNGTVANPTIGVDVVLTAYANYDLEPAYDYFFIQYATFDGFISVLQQDGVATNQFLSVAFSLSPADYLGPNQDQVVIQFLVESDGGWSDEDCLWPTAGAVQIDDITVTLDQGGDPVADFADFQSGWGSWEVTIPLGVGDFSQLWTGLNDIDPCGFNFGTQAAFIDDGLIVPGVGPTLCIDWCYGPGGYIVNTTGGRVGPDGHIHNAIESPVIPWPGNEFEGARYDFDVYRHELFNNSSPGIFYTWSIRSTASNNPEDIHLEGWQDRNFVFLGGPDYLRTENIVSDLLEPGRQYAQVQLAVYELGFVWGIQGNNGTPAPYFDNVRLTAYPFYGPGLSTREIDIAQDNFPTIGEVDYSNLANNSVRFDMARNISIPNWETPLANHPGDSIVVDVSPLRAGADLVGDPVLHFRLKRNPVFDPYRTSIYGTAEQGTMVGVPAFNGTFIIPDRFAFDLPDSNFLYPGDVLHYYIAASDDDGFEVQTATLPADTSGFGDFSRILGYDPSFTVRALPSLFADGSNPLGLSTPKILFWNDFANRGGRNEWHGALANLGFVPGRDYDTYYTNGPSSGVGNGLGGRATALVLAGYKDLLYSCGDLSFLNMSDGNGDWNDAGDDIGVIDSWLRQGDKDMLLTGDNLVTSLYNYPAGTQFSQDWLGLEPLAFDVRPLIHNQTSPRIQAVPGNGVFTEGLRFIAFGGCPGLNRFDAVQADLGGGAIQLAEFLDPNGSPGFYSYSAATLMERPLLDVRAITLPYDFSFIYTDPDAGDKVPARLPARAILLEQVLGLFGVEGQPLDVSPVPEAQKLALRSYPNPFNPAVKIEYTMPKAGHLVLKVFNLKGELVCTLVDDQIETSGHVMWDGTDAGGARVGSGVYFTEARTAGQVQVQKLVMVK